MPLRAPTALPPFNQTHLPPGTRLGLAVSGGSDSVALLRLAHMRAAQAGWVLRVLHIDHGVRGDQSVADAVFVEKLAATLGLPCTVIRAELQANQAGLEEAGRNARYRWFAGLLADGGLDAVATGHTLDDQAETVLGKLLRGAWTAGLAGVHPVVRAAHVPGARADAAGLIVRPLLAARRAELQDWLRSLDQPWREDASNADPRFTRNRLRHQMLPLLAAEQPAITEHLVRVAELARAEEQYWEQETDRLLPSLLLPGKPVRGGGRSVSTLPDEQILAVEAERIRAYPLAVRRRVLRAIADRLGKVLDFVATEKVLGLLEVRAGSVSRREELAPGFRVERTAREVRFVVSQGSAEATPPSAAVTLPVPGEAQGLGIRLCVTCDEPGELPPATLRAGRPGDRVQLRYSRGAPKRLKEILERLGVPTAERAAWPVLEWQGEVVWMRGTQLELSGQAARLTITELPVEA